MTVSNHFKNDRADRYAFIATRVGVGTVIHSYAQSQSKYNNPCVVHITSTGVAIVKTIDDVLVTMYVLTLTEAQKYFDTMPMVLTAIIKQNMKRRFHILQNEVTY